MIMSLCSRSYCYIKVLAERDARQMRLVELNRQGEVMQASIATNRARTAEVKADVVSFFLHSISRILFALKQHLNTDTFILWCVVQLLAEMKEFCSKIAIFCLNSEIVDRCT